MRRSKIFRRSAGLALVGSALVAASFATAARAGVQAVDLEPVISTDVSRSIDREEALLQRQGIAGAFRNPAVIRAIESGFIRGMPVRNTASSVFPSSSR